MATKLEFIKPHLSDRGVQVIEHPKFLYENISTVEVFSHSVEKISNPENSDVFSV